VCENDEEGDLSLSDEVEARLSFLEGLADNRRLFVLSTSLANQSSKSVSISNAGWLLDCTRHVVVSMAEFVSQALNLIWRLSDAIVDHGESAWG